MNHAFGIFYYRTGNGITNDNEECRLNIDTVQENGTMREKPRLRTELEEAQKKSDTSKNGNVRYSYTTIDLYDQSVTAGINERRITSDLAERTMIK